VVTPGKGEKSSFPASPGEHIHPDEYLLKSVYEGPSEMIKTSNGNLAVH
jgi:hypothetical protein